MRGAARTESVLGSTFARKGTWLLGLLALCSLAALAVGAAPAFSQQTLSITGFSPTTGPPGTVVTIDGTGFTQSSTVAFGGTAATGVTYVSGSELNATVPADAPPGPITITNTTTPTGSASSASSFAAWEADLATTMSPAARGGIVSPGEVITFTATVTNEGPNDAENVAVNDSFSLTATFINFSATAPTPPSCTAPSPGGYGTITCTTGSLAPAGVMRITVSLRVKAIPHAVFENSASATSTVYDPNTTNNSASGWFEIG